VSVRLLAGRLKIHPDESEETEPTRSGEQGRAAQRAVQARNEAWRNKQTWTTGLTGRCDKGHSVSLSVMLQFTGLA
jgi:hypothetical protein